ncbi:MAG: TlpA family protein disulfide reductase [Clostridia bacterium]|nr:TlpA family protein disulfide reductase [Clostridia bacterium]
MKRVLVFVLSVGMLMSLCACGDDTFSESSSAVSQSTGVPSTYTTEKVTATEQTTLSTFDTAGTHTTTSVNTSATRAVSSTVSQTSVTSATAGVTTTTTTVATATQTPSVTTATATTATTVTTTTTTTTATTVTTATTTTAVKPSLPEGDLIGKRLSVGDRMYDFTVTDSDGNTLTLSQMLQEKEMVVLNFWYINCPFCVKEFPAMNEAYAAYQDRVGMVALNPYDSVANIRQFRANNASLTFPMASCPTGWVQTFALRGFPTTLIIDRQGVIREMHVGALLKVSDWESLLLPYLS